MSLVNTIKKRLVNQFVSVMVFEDRCKIKHKIVKNSKMLHLEEFNFDIPSKDNLGEKVTSFLQKLQEDYENTYISLFLNTFGQGVIPGCDVDSLEKYNIDKKSVKTICVEDRFLMYATYIDIKWAEKLFAKIGLDFIFSPFLVLDYFTKAFKESEAYNPKETTLYILHTKNAITLMIEREGKLLYGSFLNVAKDENLLTSDYDDVDLDEGIEFDDSDLELDDSDIELDDIGDAGSDNDFSSNLLEDVILDEQDKRIIKYIDSSLKEFYSNDNYDSSFINSVRIYDDAGISEGVLNHLQDELLLDTTAQNISVNSAMLELSMMEVLS